MSRKLILPLLGVFLVLAMGAGGQSTALASGAADRKFPPPIEIDLEFDKQYEVNIGRAGVHIPNSAMQGTLVFWKEEGNLRNYSSYHVFTQAWANVEAYDPLGKQFDRVFGSVQMFFDLDVLQRRIYDEGSDRNMSIWYFDTFEGGWQKCPTGLANPGRSVAPYGRLVCPMTLFGRYGIAWTLPTLVMKLEKMMGSP